MPGLSNGDKNAPPAKSNLPPGRVVNTTLPPNRPVPPGMDQENSGGDINHPRIPHTTLTIPGSNDPVQPALPRSPLRTIIGPPNGPMAIGRPARLINNGVNGNGVHEVNGNNSDPTTVVHATNGAPLTTRPTAPISSQQVNGRNVQPGVLANTQTPRVGIQAVSVVNEQQKSEDAPTNGNKNPKRLPQNNDQEKVFLKTPNALRREEAKKEANNSTKNNETENGKTDDTKNGNNKNGNGRNASPIKRPLDKNGNGKNGGVTNSPTKKVLRTNGTNGNNKNDEKSSPVKIPPIKSSQESPKKNGAPKSQESSSPTRKNGIRVPLNPSPTKKTPRNSPSPPRKKIAKSPLPSPKTARKNVLNQSSPTKLLGKAPNNLTLVPGRPLPATTTLIGSQKEAESKDDKNAKKDEAKSADEDKEKADEKGKDKEKGKPSEATLIFDRLLTLCKRGDWLAVETLLNHLDGLQIPPDLTDPENGYTPLMYSVKDNRVFMAERFLDMGMDINIKGKSGAKCLHIAAAAGHVEVVRSLLNKGESVDIKTNDGQTALHIAVQACQPRVVETLLGYGAQIRLKAGKSGETPLHIAARTAGGEKCAELLLKSGAEVNATQEDGETPLHFAARHGHLNTVALLLQDKADVQQKSNSGETPLHVAARNCHYAVARSLLDHWKKTHPGDNGATLVNAQNELGETVLHYACLISKSQAHHPTEDKDLVKLLLQNGGEVNIPNEEYRMTCIHYCSKEGNADILHEILNQIDPTMLQGACNRIALNGWTPLLYACQKGHPEVVNLLLQNAARVDVFDEGGKAALHLAAEFGHGEVVDILLKHKAFANARSKKGMTPLHLAARNGYTEIVQKLVTQYGATLDALTLTKRTPLHLAAENGKLDVCSVLLEMRADANSIDNTGQTPLLLAAENDHPEVVKLFLRHKPELVSMANSNGFTCAHIAAMKGSVAVIKELMKFNRSMVTSARNLTGNTALHLAASGGHAEVVKVLIEAGSSATEENADGYTALHFAAKDGHVKVLQALKSAVSWRVCSKKTGMTALHVAASCGQTEFVQEMLTQIPATIPSERPGDTSLSDDYGFTPLHLAAESGHEGVVRVLLNSSGVQTDCATVVQGILPMHLAARGGHLAVAGLLLSRSTDQLQTADKQGRTPLHMAAAQGHREMVGLLLGQGADINVADNNGWTALHYTTRHGFLDVVQLLVNSGASPTAATNDGKVPLCLAAGAGHYDVLNYLLKKEHDTHTLMADSNFLIDLMVSSKAHANKPVLEFVLVSAAPIETAAKMARSYQLLSLKEKDRARDLEVMAMFCEAMAADLLGITAISYNTGTLLRSVDSQNQPFLDVLIELQQKEVVAHPAVQKYLTDLWMGSLQWASWKMTLMFFSFLICPLVWVAFSLPLGHRFTSIPIIKFMSYLVSHIFFIILLSFTIVNPWLPLWKSTHLIPYIHEWLLLLWLIGLWVSDATNPKDREGLGFIKVIIMTVGSMGILTHVVALVFSDDHSILVCLYIRNQFLAVALLLCFVEFLNFLTFHHLFGPWTVIIRDLIKDLMRFLAILGIFLVGFSLHLCAIYQPVFLPKGADNLALVVFQSPIDTFEMLFFALFGLVEPDYMPPMHLSPGFSKAIMKVVFGIYMMVTVIVLINLLIAMMSNTYQRIQAQSDTEWKFGRAKLIRNMNKTSPSPSPICLFTLFGELFYRCPKKITGMKPQLHMMKTKRDAAIQRGDVPRIMPAAWQRRCTRRSQQIMPVVQNLTAGRPIAKVVDWPSIVVKYLEVTGADIKMELPEESHPGD
ncbi:Ankyrin-1 like protein [Argiope bruennichi]|uniref:Ankyrin-1 like protein n=1 Tax=Argiope bruennichi TaxID=94029 RepID=A0A8T0EJK6_ARGBR|nr:Ankyrin-1 like protein [Argiope bruennichi]